ncbi:sugar ABC transporter ATP-binding protein [Bauldia sp.]|uniref:sugar ABC transporter ATP-binding protein n=1 Tax=Bauldia sp. TaxID=2575872 RepID=UPI003BAC4C18
MTPKTVLRVENIGKAFPGVRALADVSMDVAAGEVVALVGENGAGKSTMLKILSGDYQLDEGRIWLGDEPVDHVSPLEARQAGFRLVRQEPEIVPDMTVTENIFIGEFLTSGFRVDFRMMKATVTEMLTRYGFAGLIDVDALGRLLSPAQKHIVEIIRALKPGVRVVAFDEPTSSLTVDETKRLFRLIRQLADDGLGVIYVSHRLHEVMEISNRIVVLRDGAHAGTLLTSETRQEDVVRLMVGRDLSGGYERAETTSDNVVLEVENLTSRWHGNISLNVRAGEILGIAGLVGAGRTELAKIIFGDLPRQSGTIRVNGKPVTIRHPADAIAAGIGFAPEDRKSEGLVMVRSVIENVCLAVFARFARFGVLRRAEMHREVVPYIDHLSIKITGLGQEVGKLSGGNQQKAVLARWLAAKPQVLILDEPTRAVDVGAKAEIYRLIDELARGGLAIIVISSEMPELLALADRIMVMRGGTLSDPIEKADASEEAILSHALDSEAA